MKISSCLLFICASAFTLVQAASAQTIGISVSNSLSFDRDEVVSIDAKKLTKFLKGKQQKNIRLKNNKTGYTEPLQWVDLDNDGKPDEVLFVAKVPASGSTLYTLLLDAASAQPESKQVAYSRFVPERNDDYAWENDRVAFRTYGPDAQRRIEQHQPNGTLTSGIDLWLKRTTEPVINKWYKGYLTDPGFYHTDHGEGYDPYQVGPSRGTGGTGVWQNDSLLVSKNFVSYKTIATGPLRTIFELTYAPYSDYGVKETKRISLDVGSNFSRFEVSYASQKPVPNYAVGITLHKNEGQTKIDEQAGIFAHHESIDGAYLGEGIIINPKTVLKAFDHKSKTPDQSNLLVLTKPSTKLTYYAGFAWQKSGHVQNNTDWEAMLKRQAEIVANPLTVSVK